MSIIYFLGTDGAGKTTAARRLVELSPPERRIKYLYCQHRPILLLILELPARLLFLRRSDQFRNYEQYKSTKDAVAAKHRLLTRLYAIVSYFDVWLQTWPKILWARWTADLIVLDRYYLDWVINVGVLERNSVQAMLRDARCLERLFPKAQVHLFLDASEETAFQRKNDIQSLQYLRERRERYLQLAPHYDFQVVDANQDADTVFQQLRTLLEAVGPLSRDLHESLSRT